MRCEQCEKIPLVEIHTPQEYMLCIGSLARMLLAGEVEMTYQTCPLDKIMDNDNKWYAEKLFHPVPGVQNAALSMVCSATPTQADR